MDSLLDWGVGNYPKETFLSPAPRGRQRAPRDGWGAQRAGGGAPPSPSRVGPAPHGRCKAVLCPGRPTPGGGHRDIEHRPRLHICNL